MSAWSESCGRDVQSCGWRHWTPPTRQPSSDEALYLLATRVRAFLEPVWLQWHRARGGDVPTPLSRYTCGRSSLFLKRVLENGTCGWPDQRPHGYFGFHTGSDWSSHAWVEYGDRIIDITADQFGDAPVIVTASPDPRYQRTAGGPALDAFSHARIPAVDRLYARWRSHLDHLTIDG